MTDQAETIKIKKKPTAVILPLMFAFLFVIIVASTGMGFLKISFFDVISIIFSKFSGNTALIKGLDEVMAVVVMEVRLPRIMTAAIVGGGLAVSGAVFQGILLNPLADPYTLGVSAGAAFGACIAFLFNTFFSAFSFYTVSVLAFTGGISTLFFVMFLSSSGRGLSSNNLILSGIIVSAILSAGISFLKYIADEQVGN